MNRLVPLTAVPALAALALSGCSGPTPSPTSATTVTVTGTTAPVASTAGGTPSPSGTTTAAGTTNAGGSSPVVTRAAADPGRPTGQCADRALRVAVGEGEGAAGTAYSPVVFTNTGSTACVLRGAPGISIVGHGDGTQLGKPAVRDQSAARDVRLAAHGGTAHATLAVVDFSATDGSPIPGCSPKKGDGYRVYPPHSTRAYLVRDPRVLACDPGPAFMRVGVVSGGAR